MFTLCLFLNICVHVYMIYLSHAFLANPKLAKRPTIEELRFDNPIFESKTEKKPNDMFIPMDPPAKRNSKP